MALKQDIDKNWCISHAQNLFNKVDLIDDHFLFTELHISDRNIGGGEIERKIWELKAALKQHIRLLKDEVSE